MFDSPSKLVQMFESPSKNNEKHSHELVRKVLKKIQHVLNEVSQDSDPAKIKKRLKSVSETLQIIFCDGMIVKFAPLYSTF